MHKIDKKLHSGLSLGPKDVFYWILNHFRKSKILTFMKFLSCYAVGYPNNHLTCEVKKCTLTAETIFQFTLSIVVYIKRKRKKYYSVVL